MNIKKESMKINKLTTRKTDKGNFDRAMETMNNVFYLNPKSKRKTESVQMYDRKMNLLDAGAVAYKAYKQHLTVKNYSWLAKNLQINLVD